MRRINLFVIFISLCVAFFFFSIVINTNPGSDMIKDLLSSATFLFGIFSAFSIANAHNRLNIINDLLASEDSRVLIIYRFSKAFSKNIHKEIVNLLDTYLINQLDYYKDDFKYSYNSLVNLFDYVFMYNPKNKKEEDARSAIIATITSCFSDRKRIEVLVRQRLSKIEWIIILVLLAMIILFMLFLNNGTLLYFSATLLMVTALIFFIFLIKDLDEMQWNDHLWTWKALEEMFQTMHLLPYFPENIYREGKAIPEKGQKIRLAYYPNPYPNMKDKIVKIVSI